MVRLSKIPISVEIMPMLLEKKHDIQNFGYCIRSDSEKWDSKTKHKFAFFLISANRDSLCLGTLWYFRNMPSWKAKS